MKTAEQVQNKLAAFLTASSTNSVSALGSIPIYESPLAGVAAAGDPLFDRLKDDTVVGAKHLLPEEWLPGAVSVISYFLPFSSPVRKANREPGLPASEWLYARVEGEECNNAVRELLVRAFVRDGAQAIAPVLDGRFCRACHRSNWSERHVAFIAGLGTFGLSKSLITVRGCAGRFGSIITDAALEPTPRPYTGISAYCSACGYCIPRCPADAIKPEGKETPTCAAYVDTLAARFHPLHGCGKCQTAVPCEAAIPRRTLS